jgi:Uma2 family endonuclease
MNILPLYPRKLASALCCRKGKVTMALPLLKTRYTVEEYLALERESEERHAYLDGDIYAMAGESPEHGAICMNLYGP